jgi:hypothetical protein
VSPRTPVPPPATATLTPPLALADRRLLGALPKFHDLTTFRAWLVLLKAAYGQPLTTDELVIFQKHTGRIMPPSGGAAILVVIVGRQSGKTEVAGAIVATEGARAAHTPALADTYAILVAQDSRGTIRNLFRRAVTPFERVPVLATLVTGRTSDTLSLANGVTLAAYPCRPASVRGLRACVVVCDELAFFHSTEGNAVDVEMLRAVRPCLATTSGKLVILSSPSGQSGALYDLHRRHFGRDDSSVLVWQASAPDMNPTLPADYLARMADDDPEAYRSEVLGEFRLGVSTLFDPDALQACVTDGVRERAPSVDYGYLGFVDTASGSGKDKFTVAVARPDGEHVVLDCLRAWAPPFNPSGVIAEACDLLASYGITTVIGDRFAGGFPPELFRANGVEYVASDLDRSALYLHLLPLVNSRAAVLLDHAECLREFRGLERHRGPSGRDRVDHRRGAHDDLANAVAGALVLAHRSRIVDTSPSAAELDTLRAFSREFNVPILGDDGFALDVF